MFVICVSEEGRESTPVVDTSCGVGFDSYYVSEGIEGLFDIVKSFFFFLV